jgi:hypothetical protein
VQPTPSLNETEVNLARWFKLACSLALWVPLLAVAGLFTSADSGLAPWAGLVLGGTVGAFFGALFGGVRGGIVGLLFPPGDDIAPD